MTTDTPTPLDTSLLDRLSDELSAGPRHGRGWTRMLGARREYRAWLKGRRQDRPAPSFRKWARMRFRGVSPLLLSPKLALVVRGPR